MATKSQSRRKQVQAEVPATLRNKLAFVLDKSSSMSGIASKVVEVYNSWLEKSRGESIRFGQETSVTRTVFSDTATIEEFNNDISNIKKLTHFPTGGMTALFDGVTMTIDRLSKVDNDPDTSFVVLVVTDGGENMSTRENVRRAAKLMEDKQKKGNWTFVFMLPPGAKRHFLQNYSFIPDENVVEWEATTRGLADLEHKTTEGLGNFYHSRSLGSRSVAAFYATTDLSQVSSREIKKALDDISSECKVYTVGAETAIKEFVEEKTGRHYVLGNSYYMLMKPEKVQAGKEVLIMEKGKRQIWAGREARDLIGLPHGADAKVTPGNHSNYDIYIQSTSVNRKLPRGTKVIVRS